MNESDLLKTIGKTVEIIRDPGRFGMIVSLGKISRCPFILWDGNNIPITSEWKDVKIKNV